MPKIKSKRATVKRSSKRSQIPRQPSQSRRLNPTINAAARVLGGAGSSLLGFGPALGSELANSAHSLFKSVTGFGDYKVQANTLMTNNTAPIFQSQDRVTRIRHREFVKDVFGSIGFNYGTNTPSNSFLTPTNGALFPWLSKIASNYQQFKFKGLLFSFESKSGTAVAGTNPSLGSVIISTFYNVNESAPQTKQAMESHEFTTSTVPSANMLHPVECSPKEQVVDFYYTSQGHSGAISDARFLALGKLYIAVQGMLAEAGNLGELWVTYDIELIKPKSVVATSVTAMITLPVPTGLLWFGDINQPQTLIVRSADENVRVTIDVPGNTLIIDNSYYGYLMVAHECYNPLLTTALPNQSGIGNCVAELTPLFNAAIPGGDNDMVASAGAVASGSNTTYWKCSGGGAILFSGGALPADNVTALRKHSIIMTFIPEGFLY